MSTITRAKPRQRTTSKRQHVSRGVQRLGHYTAQDPIQRRVILAQARADGSTLVIDCVEDTLTDQRLVAHLPADEPAKNTRLMCDIYLADSARGRCRALTVEDLDDAEPHDATDGTHEAEYPLPSVCDDEGHIYRIRELQVNERLKELRWTRSIHPGREEPSDAVGLRDVVARVQDYEPARSMTAAAILAARGTGISVCRLAAELDRLVGSPIVLNRALREAVQARLRRGEMSMSQIAIRCGRVKRDLHGNTSGETSWLARRIGLIPEGGQTRPTPWVSSTVLALIARDGLGISPLEVEL
jgi:hypothetical protein